VADQQSPGVPGQPYAEEDVAAVANAIADALEANGYGYWINTTAEPALARPVLDALAAAGRLIPPDRPARSCGCPLKYVAGVDVRHQDGCEVIEKRRREDAELRAWEKATGHTEDW
jgi:hypothetical protein